MDFIALLMAIAMAIGTGLMYWGVLNQNRGYVAIGSLILYLALSLIEVLLISYVHSIAIGDPVMFVIFYYILPFIFITAFLIARAIGLVPKTANENKTIYVMLLIIAIYAATIPLGRGLLMLFAYGVWGLAAVWFNLLVIRAVLRMISAATGKEERWIFK
jgi:hypothetical protein